MAAATATRSAGTITGPIVALVIVIACVMGCFGGRVAAQTVSPTSTGTTVTLETGYIADDRYANAFFGFLLPLPKDNMLGQSDTVLEHEKALARVPLRHVLLLMQSQGSDGTVLAVFADEYRDASMEDARKALPRSWPPEKVEMGGKQFWKNSYLEENLEGPLPFLPPSRSALRSNRYATALSGYVLQINVFSPRTDIFREYVESIETLKFFEPAQPKPWPARSAGAMALRRRDGIQRSFPATSTLTPCCTFPTNCRQTGTLATRRNFDFPIRRAPAKPLFGVKQGRQAETTCLR